MYVPATAALFLAALSALPCRGTDADPSTFPQTNTQPTINIFYQMLYEPVLNETDLHWNNSSPKPLLNFSKVRSTSSENLQEFLHKFTTDENTLVEAKSLNGAIVLNDSRKNRKRRIAVKRINVVDNVAEYNKDRTTPSPYVLERRKKPSETGSSAPLLNYIFDTYSNTHQHRNDRVGHGNSIYVAAAPEIEALVGSTAYMDCKVDALHDKLVSWVRRKSNEAPMDLLTTGTQQYTADQRYSARFIPPDIWRLEIKSVRPTDAAFYDCQLSAHPPRTARVTLRVPEVSIRIVDGAGAEVSEQVCEVGSTVALRCEVRGLKMEGGPSLLWHRREFLLNDDTTRGGISVRTEFGANGANSVLRVARVRGDDAGRYSCSVARGPPPEPEPAHVMLHVIKGESLAELHQGSRMIGLDRTLVMLTIVFIVLKIYIV